MTDSWVRLTHLKVLHQEKDKVSVSQLLPLGLEQQSPGVVLVAQHHDHCRSTAQLQWGRGQRSGLRVNPSLLPLATVATYWMLRDTCWGSLVSNCRAATSWSSVLSRASTLLHSAPTLSQVLDGRPPPIMATWLQPKKRKVSSRTSALLLRGGTTFT